MKWHELVQIILGAGFASAAFNFIVTWWNTLRHEKQSAIYLALRLAVILECFAVSCYERVISLDFEYDTSDVAPRSKRFVLPVLEVYPTHEGCRVSADLAADTLSFPNEVKLARHCIEGIEECAFIYDNAKGDFRAKLHEIAEKGQLAWEIAVKLRAKYNLPAFDTEHKISETLMTHIIIK